MIIKKPIFVLSVMVSILMDCTFLFAQIPNCLDQSFGEQGILDIKVGASYEHGIVMGYQSNGKILVAGIGDFSISDLSFFLQRYHIDGSVDTSFANSGTWLYESRNLDDLMSLLVLPNDHIIVAGASAEETGFMRNMLFKFLPDGSPDPSFGTQGQYIIPNSISPKSTHVLSLPDDKFLAVGHFGSQLALVRFFNEGNIDTSFGTNGTVLYPTGYNGITLYTVAADSTGGLWIGGDIYSPSYGYFLQKFQSDGSVDSTFGINGQVVGKYAPFGPSIIKDIIPGDGGSVLVLGELNGGSTQLIALSKYHPDGSPDMFFGNGGTNIDTFMIGSAKINDLFVLPGGDLLVGGRLGKEMAFVKYSPTGIRQTNYGNDGVLKLTYGPVGNNEVSDILWNPLIGKVYALGYTVASYPQRDPGDYFYVNDVDITLTRLHPDGTLDHSYGYQGRTSGHVFPEFNQAKAMAIQADGKVVLALDALGTTGTSLMRVHPDGSPDRSFGNFGKIDLVGSDLSGYASDRPYNDGLVLYNNKIVLGGTDDALSMSVLRLLSNGLPDSTFSLDGQALLDYYTTGLAVGVHNGKIYGAGCVNCLNNNSNFLVVRFLDNGTLDTTFGTGGKVSIPIGNSNDIATHLKIRPNGKILAIGHSEFQYDILSMVQLNPNGTLDTLFGTGGKVETSALTPQSWATSTLLLENNKVLVTGGPTNVSVVQFLENGQLDLTFSEDGFIENYKDIPGLANVHVAASDGNQVVIGGQVGSDKIMLSIVSPTGTLSAPCGGTGKILEADLFPNRWEELNDMKFDNEGKLWAFGTSESVSQSIRGNTFLLRFNDLTSSFSDTPKGAESFVVFPNPCTERIWVPSLSSIYSEPSFIHIFNTTGSYIYTASYDSSENKELNVADFPSGYYFIRVETSSKVFITGFIKQ